MPTPIFSDRPQTEKTHALRADGLQTARYPPPTK